MKVNKNAKKYFNSIPGFNVPISGFSFDSGMTELSQGTLASSVAPTSSRFEQLPKVKEFQVGEGENAVHINPQGIWLGAKKFEDAPIRLTVNGQIFMSDGENDRALLGRRTN